MSDQNKTSELARSIYRAVTDAKVRKHEAVTLEHLLSSILKEVDVVEIFSKMGIDIDSLQLALDVFLGGDFINEVDDSNPHPTRAFDEVITRAVGIGMFSTHERTMPVDVLVQLIQHPAADSYAVTCLNYFGVTPLTLKRLISHGSATPDARATPAHNPDGSMNLREPTSKEEAEALLAKFTSNLNETAGTGGIDPLIGRETEVEHIIQILARRQKNNIILVGEPGVGKTAIAEGLAVKITENQVPHTLASSTVYSLDIGALMAGTRFRGDMEERLKLILKSLEMIPGSVFFIDEIHTIMGTGAGQSGALDIANLLKPSLAKGTIKCIGSTTNEEFRKHFEKDRAMMRRFKRVDINEPSIEDAKSILRGLRSRYETFHGVTYTDEALDAAVDLTARYVTNQLLPDKAIDIIDQAGARQRVAEEKNRVSVLTVTEIEAEVSRVAKIPEQTVREDESTKLESLQDDLSASVFGQDVALLTLADAVFVSRSGLRDANKPAGAFLFAGPTGVGKTEAARQLATTLGVPLIKYDMSEYMEKHSVSKLIGSPPGYVGYGDGAAGSGKLINDIEENPYSILLLDEIEKAHPDVFNILLQVMDDAKLTSSSGKSISFRNTIVIMTTNCGAEEATKRGIGFGSSSHSGDAMKAIREKFSPEFRNRLDAIVQFKSLDTANILKVVDKFLATLQGQAAERSVEIEFTPASRQWLATKGFDPAMGARPLARTIHEHIKTPLSRLMVVGSLKNGGKACVDLIDDRLVVTPS